MKMHTQRVATFGFDMNRLHQRSNWDHHHFQGEEMCQKNVTIAGRSINIVMVLKVIMLNRETFPPKVRSMEWHLQGLCHLSHLSLTSCLKAAIMDVLYSWNVGLSGVTWF